MHLMRETLSAGSLAHREISPLDWNILETATSKDELAGASTVGFLLRSSYKIVAALATGKSKIIDDFHLGCIQIVRKSK